MSTRFAGASGRSSARACRASAGRKNRPRAPAPHFKMSRRPKANELSFVFTKASVSVKGELRRVDQACAEPSARDLRARAAARRRETLPHLAGERVLLLVRRRSGQGPPEEM